MIIGDDVYLIVTKIRKNDVKLAIYAPKDIKITRSVVANKK